VNVDLSRTTQATDGDKLFSIESLTGSAFADTLIGNVVGNQIVGGPGADSVAAGDGPDRVEVRDGEGDRVGCGDGVDTAIADRLSLDTLDACEAVDALPEPADPQQPDQPDQPGGPALDDTLSFTLSGARRQRVLRQRGVRVELRCPQEPCAATASATAVLRSGDGARPVRLKLRPLTASVAGGSTRVVRLPVTRRQRKALRSALLSGQRPLFRVTARARDAAGNVAVRTLQVRSVR
jgi:Ca2+-binding RTX toxin-like protein